MVRERVRRQATRTYHPSKRSRGKQTLATSRRVLSGATLRRPVLIALDTDDIN